MQILKIEAQKQHHLLAIYSPFELTLNIVKQRSSSSRYAELNFFAHIWKY